jgi:hypothetical protein
MEFPFIISKVIQLDSEGFAVLDANTYNSRTGYKKMSYYPNSLGPSSSDPQAEYLSMILDQMGQASSKVNKLVTPFIQRHKH